MLSGLEFFKIKLTHIIFLEPVFLTKHALSQSGLKVCTLGI